MNKFCFDCFIRIVDVLTTVAKQNLCWTNFEIILLKKSQTFLLESPAMVWGVPKKGTSIAELSIRVFNNNFLNYTQELNYFCEILF